MDIHTIAKELKDIEQALQIFSKLKGLIITAKHIESSNDNGEYHLMELDSEKHTVNLLAFNQKQLALAEMFYKAREMETKDIPHIEVVLISAGNLKASQKKLIQTTFLDTQDFIKSLTKICDKLNEQQIADIKKIELIFFSRLGVATEQRLFFIP